MSWNRGLGRRKMGRLHWDPEAQSKPPSDHYVAKKRRMNDVKVSKQGKLFVHDTQTEAPS